MAISPTRPPTTPPAIAPTLLLLELPGVSVGAAVAFEMLRVADRAVKDGTRVKYTERSGLSHVDGAVTVAPPVGLDGSQ